MQLGAQTVEPEPVEQQSRLRRDGLADNESRARSIANDQRDARAGARQYMSRNGTGRSAADDANVEAGITAAPSHRVQWT